MTKHLVSGDSFLRFFAVTRRGVPRRSIQNLCIASGLKGTCASRWSIEVLTVLMVGRNEWRQIKLKSYALVHNAQKITGSHCPTASHSTCGKWVMSRPAALETEVKSSPKFVGTAQQTWPHRGFCRTTAVVRNISIPSPGTRCRPGTP